ncbi:hypothetical protein [Streptomyces sp. NBC_00620]|uniref:hypothetical protein n=1 Tax=unclassified Streptomyces TaxID=2593676 RepID=UPI00224F78DA|nr:hypothetical protein [Streptomyces sp. NBC_00620]MCX4973564.1 hypothetical protein [Streptomyces sp. NBC_00620]WUC12039.1 hypothetical protein OG256_20035 [Streptomyces sp. NBC_00564]
MTQSGQGEEPSPRPAREGIVLPSDGGAPLLPGTTGDRTTPAGGQAWDRPWGPDQQAAPAPQPGQQPDQGWGAPLNGTQTWGAAQPPGPNAPAADWGTPDASQGWAPAEPRPGWGDNPAQQQPMQELPGAYGAQELPGSLPGSRGAQQPQGFAPQSQPAPGAGTLPPEGASAPSYGSAQVSSYGGAQAAYEGHDGGVPQGPPVAQPLPPVDAGVGGGAGVGSSVPLPPAAVDGATQYIPHIPPAPLADEGATQYIPHIPPAASVPAPAAVPDEGATQYIPPVGPGALPPEVQADATQFLGRAPQGGAGPLPPAAHPDAQATQYIPPVPAQSGGAPYGVRPGGPEDRQPPAEFDNLFRSEPSAPASTQQLPRFDPSAPHGAQAPQAPQGAHASYGAQAPGAYGAQNPGAYGAQAPGAPGAPGGRAAARRGGANDGGGGRGGRGGSRVPLIAAVGIGIAVLGIGAGALLSSGGDADSDDNSTTVSATAPATEGSESASAADPAKAQAVELDKLLADANASRDSVINAVADVTACKNLGQAASDLRDAANQRGELVTRLDALSLDKLPNHAELTTALTNGWKASESADNHYAAWADQAAGKKGCKNGQARGTGQSQAAVRDSGTASTAKEKAAKLWNSIASKYGLTERTRIQL